MIECSSAVCDDLDEDFEDKSFFEENFWYFLIPAGMILAISIFMDLAFELVIVDQTLAVIAILLSSSGVMKEAIEDVKNKKITATTSRVLRWFYGKEP